VKKHNTTYRDDIRMDLLTRDVERIEKMDGSVKLKSLLYTALIGGGDTEYRLEATRDLRDAGIIIITRSTWVWKWVGIITGVSILLSFVTSFLYMEVHNASQIDFVGALSRLFRGILFLWIVLAVIAKMLFFPRLKFTKKRKQWSENPEFLRSNYESKSDEELLTLREAPSKLTKDALKLLECELERRKLNME
jgi:hypothetical protein